MGSIKDAEKISELILEIITQFFEKDKRAQSFGTGTKIYHSEIHMIQSVRENEYAHISALARMLKITRGAASQTVKRLETKGFLVKEIDKNNKSRVVLKLTPKGETAYQNHRKLHEAYSRKIFRILKDAEEDQLKFLYNFLLEVEKAT